MTFVLPAVAIVLIALALAMIVMALIGLLGGRSET
jgi:hypothetical protein